MADTHAIVLDLEATNDKQNSFSRYRMVMEVRR